MEKNKKIVISIAIVLVILFLIIFKGNSSKKDDYLQGSVVNLNSEIVSVNKDILISEANVNLSESNKIFLEKRVKEYESKLNSYDDKTLLEDKINIYFAIFADYKTLGKYSSAKESLEKAMNLDPQNSNLMQSYSSLLSIMGDKENALVYINKAINLYFKESNYWLWKIDLEKEKGASNIYLDAVYKESLVKTNNDLTMIVSYAGFLGSIDKKEYSIKMWQKAIEIYPTNKTMYQAEIDRLKKI